MPKMSLNKKAAELPKRSVAILLLISMLSGSMVSCSESPVQETEKKAQSADTSAAAADTLAEETKPDAMAHLGEKNFEGRDFVVLGAGPGSGEWQNFEILAETVTGEPINDAVYERNTFINETYNVKLVALDQDGHGTAFRNAVLSNTDDYQASMYSVNSATSLAMEGILYDFCDLPVVDLTAPWYDQNANESLSVANRLYFSFGDMNLQNLDLTWCVMFNKQLAGDHQIGDVYSLVENNEWTMDKMIELSTGITKDLNGDGKMDNNDYYGASTTLARTAMAFMYAAGIRFVDKDANDYPVYKPLEEISYNVFSDVLRFYYTDNILCNLDRLSGTWRTAETMFMNNQFLFYIECMQNLSRFREMEVDFGVVPMPKYTADQEEYISMVCDFPSALVIPAYCMDPDFTGFMVEAINAKSSETVRPTYVDKCLMYKYSRDEESGGMLEIILDTMYYDPAYIYAWGGLTDTIGLLVSKNYDMLASQAKSIDKKMQKDLEECVEAYKKNQ